MIKSHLALSARELAQSIRHRSLAGIDQENFGESDAGLNNTSLTAKKRQKRNDRARVYEPLNRMR